MEEYQKSLIEKESLAEKKARVYSRLLTDHALAEMMETIANFHAQRRRALCGKEGK